MPRAAKGARLQLKSDNRPGREPQWVIRDGPRRIPTGLARGQVGEAERALRDYLGQKTLGAKPADPLVADAVLLYTQHKVAGQARPNEVKARLLRVTRAFGARPISSLRQSDFDGYAAAVGSAARRDLEDLRSALNYAWEDKLIAAPVKVKLPPKPPNRERWLTRDEVARLLWAAWRASEKQEGKETRRRPYRHLARFILFALYSASRAGVVLDAGLKPSRERGHVDLKTGLFYRKPAGTVETNKRARPIPLPPKMLSNIARWQRKGFAVERVVEYRGAPITKLNKAFRSIREIAGLGADVVPHTLRHTAVSWATMNGGDPVAICRYASLTLEVYDKVYAHLAPGFVAAGGIVISRPVCAPIRGK